MTTTDPKLIEPVAWMYRWKDEPPVCMDSKRDWAVHNADWTETPLYTAAAINEAVQNERAGIVEQWFTLEWIAASRPPVHPEPMTGRQSFDTFDDAMAFYRNLASDATFVSLIEHRKAEVDRSAEARTAIEAHKESQP